MAVSGGPDSLCLAWLAAGWGKPLALIVDHGLRADSAAEAQLTSRRLAAFGVAARILTLHGLLPGPGLAARARTARYAALIEAAAAEGLSDLVLGHHAQDQAETVMIRTQSGSGRSGLSGMAAIVETTGLRKIRPLLSVLPGRLRATLRAQAIGWIDDPSNADIRTTRSRMRALLATSDDIRSRLAAAGQNARDRLASETAIADALAERVAFLPQGFALLTPGPADPGLLAALIRALSGADFPPRGRALARLAADPRGCLGGLRFMPAGRLGPSTLVVREAACVQPPRQAVTGAVWDRRFRLQSEPVPPGTLLGALGALGALAAGLRPASRLPAAVLAVLPALRTPDGGLAVPHIDYFHGWTNGPVRLTFNPAIPAAGAGFMPVAEGDA